jgi:hypothetical protein
MANKYPKPVEIKSIQFTWKWRGNRTPTNIKFPNGKETKVQYMRDGIILFDSGEQGSYIRTWDDNNTLERTIIIEIEE